MTENSQNGDRAPRKLQFSLLGLLKLTAFSALLAYVFRHAWSQFASASWSQLGLLVVIMIALAPFYLFADIIDWLLGVKRR